MASEGSSDAGAASAPSAVEDIAPAAKRRKLNPSEENAEASTASASQPSQPSAQSGPSPFARAKEVLHTSRIPSRLVGREAELQLLGKFFSDCRESGQGKGLYVCGHPGTGKTASLLHLFRQMSSSLSSNSSQELDISVPIGSVTFLNCMRLSSMSIRLFCSYLRTRVEENSSMSLSDAVDSFADDDGTVDTSSHGPLESSDDAAMTSLEKYLLTRPTMTVLILDEIDHLLTSQIKKMLLYRLYELPHLRNSRVITIGIANTLDLPERLLPNLANKKMSPVTVAFKSYTPDQIAAIIRERLGDDTPNVFDAKALELLSKKISESCLGDCRKALTICSQAAADALALASARPVSIAVMNKLANKLLDAHGTHLAAAAAAQQKVTTQPGVMQKPLSGMAVIINSLPLQHQIALLAVQHLTMAANRPKDILMPAAFEKYKSLCKIIKTQPQTGDGFAAICSSLESYNIISVTGGASDVKKRKLVSLVTNADLSQALHDHLMLKQVLPSQN